MENSNAELVDRVVEVFKGLVTLPSAVDPGALVNPADAFFAYRLLLGRSPDTATELPALVDSKQTYHQFMTQLLASPEYRHRSGYFPADRFLMAELDGFRFWFNTSDREMGVIMALGMYEPDSVNLVRRIVQPGMHCLDIGAQTGFFTCLLARCVGPAGKVHAFEPMPASYQLLERNIHENVFTDRVITHPLAASNAKAEISASKLANMYVAGDVQGAESICMKTVRIDDVISERIDFIKIDIEGHEPAAIEGMQSLIRKHKPIILTEANEYWLRTCSRSSADAYVGLLVSLGYDVFSVKEFPKALEPGSLKLEILDCMDLVAFPTGR